MRGLFISFEGGDGTGKTTQIQALKEWLDGQGLDVVATREPGGTKLGEQVREIVLHGQDISPRTEALFYAADRAHHVASKVRPALARGAVVITDRYLDSSVAYQGAARSLGVDEVRELSLWAVEGLLPDLTIILDVPADVAGRRAQARAGLDRLESAGSAFHEAVREQFLQLAKREPERCKVVDGARSPEEIAQAVRELVDPLVGEFAAAGELVAAGGADAGKPAGGKSTADGELKAGRPAGGSR